MRQRIVRYGALLLGLLPLASCSAVTAPRDVVFGCDREVGATDLRVELINFFDHEDPTEGDATRIELRVVQLEDLVMRAVLTGIDESGTGPNNADNASALCLVFPGVLADPGGYQVQTWIDDNTNGMYDPVDDSAWEDSVEGGYASFNGTDDLQPFDASTGEPGDFNLQLTGMDPHVPGTQSFSLMVIDTDGDVVGYARVADVNSPDFRVTIPGVLSPDEEYTVEMYADSEQNGVYDPLDPVGGGPFDHAWRVTYTAGPAPDGGIDESYPHNGDFVALEYF